MTKYKVGDELYYMQFSKVQKGKVIGISTCVGTCYNGTETIRANDGVVVLYHFGSYTSLKEEELFGSIEDLKTELFKKFEETSE